MILREPILTYFLVLHGEQTLSFPSDGDQNVTLILANNNTGKTRLIRALKFLFYGARALGGSGIGSRPSTIINERAAHDVPIGEDVEAAMQLSFGLGEDCCCFRRSVWAARSADGLDRGEERLTQLGLGTHNAEH